MITLLRKGLRGDSFADTLRLYLVGLIVLAPFAALAGVTFGMERTFRYTPILVASLVICEYLPSSFFLMELLDFSSRDVTDIQQTIRFYGFTFAILLISFEVLLLFMNYYKQTVFDYRHILDYIIFLLVCSLTLLFTEFISRLRFIRSVSPYFDYFSFGRPLPLGEDLEEVLRNALREASSAVDIGERLLAAARERGERRTEVTLLVNVSIPYWILGDVLSALRLSQQAAVIAREIGDRDGECIALHNWGVFRGPIGSQCAISPLEQALAIVRETENRRTEVTILGNLGLAYLAAEVTPRAIEVSQQALTIARDIGDRSGESIALRNLGIAYRKLGDIPRAIEVSQQALAIAREIGDRHIEVSISLNLSQVFYSMGDYTRALDNAEIARRFLERKDDLGIMMIHSQRQSESRQEGETCRKISCVVDLR